MAEQSENAVIETLARILQEARAAESAATGACVYQAGAKVYCAALSKADCDKLNGTWTEGGKCP